MVARLRLPHGRALSHSSTRRPARRIPERPKYRFGAQPGLLADGRAVASVANNKLIVWNPRSATPREVLTGPRRTGAGRRVRPRRTHALHLIGRGSCARMGPDRRTNLRSAVRARRAIALLYPGRTTRTSAGSLAHGTTFAVRLGTSSVGLFSARTLLRRESFTVKPAGAVITALAWSPTAPELAVGGSSGLVQLWRIGRTPRLERSLSGLQAIFGKPEAIQALSFSPDGRLIAGSDDNVERIQDSMAPTAQHPNDRIASLAIWRTSNGRLTAPTRGLGAGSARFTPLAFSPNGRLVAAGTPHGRDLVLDAPVFRHGTRFTRLAANTPHRSRLRATAHSRPAR